MREAMQHAGLRIDDIPTLRRDASRYLGFIEVHIEQGPVLFEMGLPLGIVTSINGSVRYMVQIFGMACHAGTTPMDRRRDAATATAELALAERFDQRRAGRMPIQPGLARPQRPATRCAGQRRAGRAGRHLPAARRALHAR
ncbi:hypothetical protein G6F68_017214 [Rhizopus microsporus]|nr:hypothetical protein G6F68_017214 [Rhizopus microsporus]